MRPLQIPVILGTSRKERMSEHVARFLMDELKGRGGVEATLVDVREVNGPIDDEGAGIKDPGISDLFNKADAFIIVAPEYNHGYPGSLKHFLDSYLKEYIHKAVGICGVSAGSFGGTRVIQNLLPVMRELGLVTIFWDGNFSSVKKIFDEDGNLLEEAYAKRIDKFMKELFWMARVLRHGRESITL